MLSDPKGPSALSPKPALGFLRLLIRQPDPSARRPLGTCVHVPFPESDGPRQAVKEALPRGLLPWAAAHSGTLSQTGPICAVGERGPLADVCISLHPGTGDLKYTYS